MKNLQAILWLATSLVTAKKLVTIVICDIDAVTGLAVINGDNLLDLPYSNRITAEDISGAVAFVLKDDNGDLIDGAVDIRAIPAAE